MLDQEKMKQFKKIAIVMNVIFSMIYVTIAFYVSLADPSDLVSDILDLSGITYTYSTTSVIVLIMAVAVVAISFKVIKQISSNSIASKQDKYIALMRKLRFSSAAVFVLWKCIRILILRSIYPM
eukprot:532378_1